MPSQKIITKKLIASVEQIESRIFLVRGQKVMLDEDLAALYEVEVKVLNQAVKRNLDRFPDDSMFQLSAEEALLLRSQFVTLKSGRGQHRKYSPYAFTEQGVAMLSSVLHSDRAIQVNIEIMRAFVRLRQMLSTNAELWIKQLVKLLAIPLSNQKTVAKWLVIAIRLGCQRPQPSRWLSRKLAALEKKCDIQFKAVFEAIRELMTPLEPKKKRPIGFAPWEKK